MKLFKITYNDGGWHSGDLPHFYCIASREGEVMKCKQYQIYKENAELTGGIVWIKEIKELVGRDGILSKYEFEDTNFDDYEISINIRRKGSDTHLVAGE